MVNHAVFYPAVKFVFVASVLMGTGFAQLPPIFNNPVAYSTTGEDGYGIAVGDINGDGHPDVVTTSYVSPSNSNYGLVTVFTGNGDGTFQLGKTYQMPGYWTNSVALADLNGDGKLDIVALSWGIYCGSSCNGNGFGSLSVLLGNGDGTFQSPVSYYTVGYSPYNVVVGDINGDGKPDVLVSSQCQSNTGCFGNVVGVMLGNGDGTLQAMTFYSGGGQIGSRMALADVNGDGKPDAIVVGNVSPTNYAGTVGVLINNGSGGFRPVVSYNPGGYSPSSVTVADVNGDGKLDIVVSECTGENPCPAGGAIVGILAGNGDGTFSAPTIVSAGASYAESVKVADMNGDGTPDLVVSDACTVRGGVSILLGLGGGTFGTPTCYDAAGYSTVSTAVEDVNGDGYPDVLVMNESAGANSFGTVGVLLGVGDGTLKTFESYPVGASAAYAVASSDVNGDGYPDLVVADQCQTSSCTNGAVSVLLGKVDGTFQPAVAYNSGGYATSSVAIADVNGDGHPDMVVANQCSNSSTCSTTGSVSMLLGRGDGTFQSPVSYNSGGVNSTWVALADVNGDGRLDVIVANGCLTSGTCNGGIAVLLGNGDGTFQTAIPYSTGASGTLFITVADVNADGHPDLIAASGCQSNTNCTNGVVSVFLGNGDGTFQSAVNYSSGGLDAQSLAIADWNGDGRLDILVTNQCAIGNCLVGTYGLLLGNGDGTFQPVATSAAPQMLGAQTIVTGDFNGDGHLDVVFPMAAELLLGNGDGTFQSPVSIGGYGRAATVLDINADGKPDLAMADGENAVVVMKNITSGFRYATTTSVSTSANPATGPVTLAAVVSPAFNAGPATGTVTFYDGATALGSGSIASGQASLSNLSFSVGSHSITGVYSGDTNYLSSNSAPLSQVVNVANTTTTLTSSLNPSAFNQPVTFTATVTASGGNTPTGNVTFLDGSTSLGLAALSGGTATFTTSALATGSHSITASYAGSMQDNASSSSAMVQVVEVQTTAVALTSSANPSVFDQPVTLTATISSTFGGAPTGTVTFSSGTSTLGSAAVNGSGVATLSVAAFPVGTDSLVASYSGDSNYNGSSSTAVNQVVQKAGTSTALTFNSAAGNLTLSAAVSPATSGTPTGSVIFLDGTTQLGTASLNGSGVATLSTSAMTAGTHSITASYGGDADFKSSNSSANSVVADFSLSAAALSPSSVAPGQSAATVISIVSTNGLNPAGVSFACSVAPLLSPAPSCSVGIVTSSNGSGSATLTVSTTAAKAMSAPGGQPRSNMRLGLGLLLVPAMLFGAAGTKSRQRRRILSAMAIGCVLAGCMLQSACGGGSSANNTGSGGGSPGTPAGSYTITISGSAGTTQHTTSATLTVQ